MINEVVRIYELVIYTSVWSLHEVNADGNYVIHEFRQFLLNRQVKLEKTIYHNHVYLFVTSHDPQTRSSMILQVMKNVEESSLSINQYFKEKRAPFSQAQYYLYKKILKEKGREGLSDQRCEGNNLRFRETTQGMLSAYVLQERVWVWDGEEEEVHCWHLIVRREIDSPKEIKYSLSNVSEETSIERLAFMQGRRFWASRTLQDRKTECGLGCGTF